MKKAIYLALLGLIFCMGAKNARAQMDTLFTDTVLIDVPFQDMVDSCFEHVDLDLVPTGLLLEYAYPTIDLKLFDGTLTDSNYAHTYSWRKAYGTLLRSFIDSTQAFDTLGTIVTHMQVYIDSGLVPISMLNYQYNSIKPSALTDSLFYLSGIQLYDMPGRTQSPYAANTCFMAAPALAVTDENTVRFVFNENFYISNDTRTVDYLQVDFGNGTNHILAWGDTIAIIFDSTYTDVITVELVFTDSSSLSSHFTMEVNKSAPINLGPYSAQPDIRNWALGHAAISNQLVVSVRFGCGNGSGHILKPFVVLGGYGDPVSSILGSVVGGYPNGGAQWAQLRELNRDIYEYLYKQGYDLIYATYVDGSAAIQANAAAVETMIIKMNEEKAAYGSTHKNVLLGVSMGGVVGRYALAHMYQQHLFNAANPPHDTKLFFSFDSPHWGANAPLGLQAMVVDLYRQWLEMLAKGKTSKFEFEDVYWDYQSITSPAAKQMLINHVYWNFRSLHTAFYDELKNVSFNGGQEGNIGCRTIAISNGSGKGVDNGWFGQYDKAQVNPMYPGANILNFEATQHSGYHVWAVPANALGNRLVYKGYYAKGGVTFDGLNLWFSNKFSSYHATANQCNALDCAPGGNGDVGTGVISHTLAPFVNLPLTVSRPFQKYCFIPIISALHVPNSQRTNYFAWIDGGAGPNQASPLFNAYISNDKPGVTTPSTINDFHVAQTFDNYQVFNEIRTIDDAPPAILDATEFYNFGLNTTDKLGSMELKSGARLLINNNQATGFVSPPLSKAGFANPGNNTGFKAYTFDLDCEDLVVVTAKSGSEVIVGDPSSQREGNLVFREGSTLVLEGGSDLKIYGNSTLVIEEGATLQVHPGASILLDGGASNLIIKGTLVLENNTTFTYSGDGFVTFNCPANTYCNMIMGTNCSMNMEGSNRNSDKILEVTGKGINLSGLDEFRLKKGYTTLGTNTEIVVEKSLHLEKVYFTREAGNTNNYVYKGVVMQNQPSASTVFIEDCLFEHAVRAIKFTKATSGINQLAMSNTAFLHCSLAVHTEGGSFLFKQLRFESGDIGWLAGSTNDLSDFKGYVENVDYGINYDGYSGADLYVYESTFTGCSTAVSVSGDVTLTSRCSHYLSNVNDIFKDQSDLNISDDVFLSRADPLNTVGNGGYNLFNNTTGTSIYVNDLANLYAYKGFNEFIYNSNPTHVFDGDFNNVPTPHVRLQDNYWSLYNGGTQVFDLASAASAMWSVEDMYNAPANYNTTTTWSTHTTCSNAWDGEMVIEGVVRENTPSATKRARETGTAFVIYPNPTDELLYVQNTHNQKNYTLRAIDVTGRVIYLQSLSDGGNTQTFDVSGLAAGMYQLLIEQNGITMAKQKVVIR